MAAGGANGQAANGWGAAADGGSGAAAGRPPRSKMRLSPRQGDSDAQFTEASAPLRRGLNEASESEAAALSGSGQHPAHLYAGPADRSNQAAAGYLRNQGFTFPTMLSAGASPGQSQLLPTAPRVRASEALAVVAVVVVVGACIAGAGVSVCRLLLLHFCQDAAGVRAPLAAAAH